jgi:hypothetical protein
MPTIPQYKGGKLRFPQNSKAQATLNQEFEVKGNGTITVSNWLMKQTYQFAPESRGLAPHDGRFKQIAMKFFVKQAEFLIKRKYSFKRKGYNEGDGGTHVQGDVCPKINRSPFGLIPLGEVLETQMARLGVRVTRNNT